ncbi:hypothetical protein TrST_g788 [Triparma strigata]|uniref:Uncharacterized protein n=1 Tax=Triparma strigata TaxID=1606541 RepID=A0A9W7APW1_9STRA|nr:hypothetical protein TrST_g788 [Triparma strigata]
MNDNDKTKKSTTKGDIAAHTATANANGTTNGNGTTNATTKATTKATTNGNGMTFPSAVRPSSPSLVSIDLESCSDFLSKVVQEPITSLLPSSSPPPSSPSGYTSTRQLSPLALQPPRLHTFNLPTSPLPPPQTPLELLDHDFIWSPITVQSHTPSGLKISYLGWPSTWDEIIPYPSPRLSRHQTYTKTGKGWVRMKDGSRWPARIKSRMPQPGSRWAEEMLKQENRVFVEFFPPGPLPTETSKWVFTRSVSGWSKYSPPLLPPTSTSDFHLSLSAASSETRLWPVNAFEKGSLLSKPHRVLLGGGELVNGSKYSGEIKPAPKDYNPPKKNLSLKKKLKLSNAPVISCRKIFGYSRYAGVTPVSSGYLSSLNLSGQIYPIGVYSTSVEAAVERDKCLMKVEEKGGRGNQEFNFKWKEGEVMEVEEVVGGGKHLGGNQVMVGGKFDWRNRDVDLESIKFEELVANVEDTNWGNGNAKTFANDWVRWKQGMGGGEVKRKFKEEDLKGNKRKGRPKRKEGGLS